MTRLASPWRASSPRADQGATEVIDHPLPRGAPHRRLPSGSRVPDGRLAEGGGDSRLFGHDGGARGAGQLHHGSRAADQQPRIRGQIDRGDARPEPQGRQVLGETVHRAELRGDGVAGFAGQVDERPAGGGTAPEEGLRVDEPGGDHHPLGRDHLGAVGRLEPGADGGDPSVFDDHRRPGEDVSASRMDFAAHDGHRLAGGDPGQASARARTISRRRRRCITSPPAPRRRRRCVRSRG